ncbi:MAG: hypothetical protein IJM90_00140 [Firmicutes bacterium]|nr:hypothetical protein [Bacillota bacterium]
MKKHLLAFLLLLILLCSCLSHEPEPVPSEDNNSSAQTEDKEHQDSFNTWKGNSMCRLGNVYYYRLANTIHYCEIESGQTGFLCGKPECDHTDPESCNAIVGQTGFLASDNTWLYVQVREKDKYYLCRISPDGTIRENVTVIPDPNGWNSHMCLYQGNVYLCTSHQEVIDGNPKFTLEFYKQGIDSDEPQLIFTKEAAYVARNVFQFIGDEMYFALTYAPDASAIQTAIWKYTISSDSWELQWEGNLEGNGWITSFWKEEQKLICGIMNWDLGQETVQVFDLRDRTFTTLFSAGEELLNIDISEHYCIIGGGGSSVYDIYDHAGNLLDHLDLAPDASMDYLEFEFMGSDEESVFIKMNYAESDQSYTLFRWTPDKGAVQMDQMNISSGE